MLFLKKTVFILQSEDYSFGNDSDEEPDVEDIDLTNEVTDLETLNSFCPSRFFQVCPHFPFLQNANLYRKRV